MKLTDEQRAAIAYNGNAFIEACPGSGKTTTLVRKLLKIGDALKDSSKRIACITYTNAAVFEIEDRLRKFGAHWLGDLCQISTIHTFCLNELLRNYCWRIADYKNGFTVLAPDTDEYQEIVRSVIRDYELSSDASDKFEGLNFEPDGTPIVPPEVGLPAAKAFWKRLSDQRYIDFPNMVYQAYRLLVEHPGICRALSSKFAWFLIDEFQDTSAIQVEILREIAKHARSRFFLVGDPHQSIFGFAGGRPDLMSQFASEIGAKHFPLSWNFRSSIHIVANAEKLIPRRPPMNAAGMWRDFPHAPKLLEVARIDDGLVDHFLSAVQALDIPYSECAILSPSWYSLLPVARRMRALSIPIIGPGARPYKGNHQFSRLAEQVCAYLTEPHVHRLRRVQREMFLLLSELNGDVDYRSLQFEGTVSAMRLIREGKRICIGNEGAIDWLQEAGTEFEKILVADGWLKPEALELLPNSSLQMQREIQRNIDDVANLSVQDLGLFGVPDKSLKLLTMHKAKGHEFDAVALIDVHDSAIPHKRSRTAAGIAEAQRLLYVAMTRPRKLLVSFTRQGYRRSRFLDDL